MLHIQPFMRRQLDFLGDHPEVARLISDIPKEGVRGIFVFGSYARGTPRPFSDIDICIIADRDMPRDGKEILYSYASRTIQISLFFDLPPALRFRVLKEGIQLWGADDLELHRIKVSTIRTYFNVRPMIERHIRKVMG